MEIWKEIPSYEGFYKVSNKGRIYSIKKKIIKKLDCNNCGYERVQLRTPFNKGRFFIHRLVAQVFIPNTNNLPYVNHIDADKSNNMVENLEWVTASENSKHAHKMGLQTGSFQGTPVKVQFEKSELYFESFASCAKSLGCSQQTISRHADTGKLYKPMNCYILTT